MQIFFGDHFVVILFPCSKYIKIELRDVVSGELGSVRFMIGLSGLKGLLQRKFFYGSMIIRLYSAT